MEGVPRRSCRFVGLTLRVKLCGRGLRAEADAARRSPPLTLMRLRTACRRDSSELTRRFSAGPKPGRISFYAELGSRTMIMQRLPIDRSIFVEIVFICGPTLPTRFFEFIFSMQIKELFWSVGRCLRKRITQSCCSQLRQAENSKAACYAFER